MASQIGQSGDSVKTRATFRQATESHSSLCHLILPGWAVQSSDSWSRCSICWCLLLNVLPMMTVPCPLSVTDRAASCPPVLPIFLFVNVPLSSRFSWAHHQRFNWPTFLSARHDWVTEFSQWGMWGILCHQLSCVLKRGPLVLRCLCSSPPVLWQDSGAGELTSSPSMRTALEGRGHHTHPEKAMETLQATRPDSRSPLPVQHESTCSARAHGPGRGPRSF